MNGKIWVVVYFVWLACVPTLAWGQESPASYQNEYPIVLVHGLGGWGRDEMLSYKYWGGTVTDLQEYLRDQGFIVYTASVGPISSNHDRACELFYQIKGGQVDYGREHAEQFQHNRYGRSFPGFYAGWDALHPVHLIGHSMGGQTIRVLSELLAQDFFRVGTDETWIKSLVTISTPHNGSTMATLVDSFSGGSIEQIVANFLSLVGSDLGIYNFDMEQWNLYPLPGESLKDFFKRIDTVVGKSKDLSKHDVLPSGARELNQRVRTFPTLYYFSYATEETFVPDPMVGYECPELSMNPMFWVTSTYMGKYQGSDVQPASAWWKNDGVVNWISMKGPHNAQIVTYTGEAISPGVWYYMGCTRKDHGKIVGHYQDALSDGAWFKSFYEKIAVRLYQLPN